MSRNSITPSRAFFTIGLSVLMIWPSAVGSAHDACGFGGPGEHLAVEWLGWEGRLWVDGTDAEQPLRLGDRIRLSGDGEPLRLFRPRPETSGGGSRG